MLGIDFQKSSKGKWPTPPFDPRFPNQNQTRNCYQNFLGKTPWAKSGAAGERRWEAGWRAPPEDGERVQDSQRGRRPLGWEVGPALVERAGPPR